MVSEKNGIWKISNVLGKRRYNEYRCAFVKGTENDFVLE